MNHRYAYCLLALVLYAINLFGQLPIIRNFTVMDYSSGTKNWNIIQSEDDRIFFANTAGLLEFDGDKWNKYPVSNSTPIHSICFDHKEGRIYAGARDEFGYFYTASQTHKIQYKSISEIIPNSQKTFGYVWNIHNYKGEMVFVTINKLFIYNKNKQIKTIYLPYMINMTAQVNNSLIICCREGIYKYNKGKLLPINGTNMLKGKDIQAVLPFLNRILFATKSDGLYLYDGNKLSPYILDITPKLKNLEINCATVSDNCLAFGTYNGGVIVKNYLNGKNYYANMQTGLQDKTVLSVMFDKDKNLWAGLNNGISYIMLETPFTDLLGENNKIGGGYASIIKDDKLYLGTNQGLFYTSKNRINITGEEKPKKVIGISGQIWNIANIYGNLLCGCSNGTYLIKNNLAKLIDSTETFNFKPLNKYKGYAIACANNGFILLKYSDNNVKVITKINGYKQFVSDFEEAKDGTLWVSNWQKGIYHFWLSKDLKNITKYEYFNKNNGLPQNDNNLITKIRGHIYITSSDGIRQYNKNTCKLEKSIKMNHLLNIKGQALKIKEMPDGKLWIYRDNYLGIGTPIKNGYAIQKVSFGNHIRRLQMYIGNIGILDKNHSLLNYDNGFYVINNDYIEKSEKKKCYIRAIYINEKNKNSLVYIHSNIEKKQKIEIPHENNSIKIEFVMPEYRDYKAVSYSCYLEGYDERWSIGQTSTSKEYTQLCKGNYTFKVKATNLITGQTDIATINLKVLPAWYETWYAIIGYIVIGVILIMITIKLLQKHSINKINKIKEENKRVIKEQQTKFLIEKQKKEQEVIKLKNEQLTLELKHKASELADSTMNLVRKNDILQTIDSHMEELSDSVKNEDTKTSLNKRINNIRREIKYNMTEDDNWDKFKENFNIVYDNFIQKLINLYPELKKNDLKLCAYLKMGLSSKEMASLLNTSVRSIETARYRLRKKLYLNNRENLTNFIQNLDK